MVLRGRFASTRVLTEDQPTTNRLMYHGKQTPLVTPFSPSMECRKRSGGDVDVDVSQDYVRTRVLEPDEERAVCSLWDHVQRGLEDGIETEYASSAFRTYICGVPMYRRAEMQVKAIEQPTSSHIIWALSSGSNDLTREQQEKKDRVFNVRISINGALVLEGLVGFRVRNPTTKNSLRSGFKEMLTTLSK